MTETVSDLMPCPFCGSTDLGDKGPSYTQIMCNACGVSQYDQPSRAEAVAAWNRRATPPQNTDGEAVAVEHFFDLEHSDVPDAVRSVALKLAVERGGQTCPVSDYDVRRAREIVTGEVAEVDRLRGELKSAASALSAMKAERDSLKEAVGRQAKALEEAKQAIQSDRAWSDAMFQAVTQKG